MPPWEFQQLLSWSLSVWLELPWSTTSTVVVFAITLFGALLVWLDHDINRDAS
jgi:hypothetical protein